MWTSVQIRYDHRRIAWRDVMWSNVMCSFGLFVLCRLLSLVLVAAAAVPAKRIGISNTIVSRTCAPQWETGDCCVGSSFMQMTTQQCLLQRLITKWQQRLPLEFCVGSSSNVTFWWSRFRNFKNWHFRSKSRILRNDSNGSGTTSFSFLQKVPIFKILKLRPPKKWFLRRIPH